MEGTFLAYRIRINKCRRKEELGAGKMVKGGQLFGDK